MRGNWYWKFGFVLVFSAALVWPTTSSLADDKVHKIGEITVEAMGVQDLKYEKQKEPAMKEIITQEEIKKMDIKNAYDFFQNIPGISVNNYGGGAIGYYSRISIRGTDLIPYGMGYSVFLDDVPLTLMAGKHPGHGFPDLTTISADMIDHIEIIKGPYSTDAGDFNTQGVIKFYTKKYSEKNSATVAFGSYGYNRESLVYSGKSDSPLGKVSHFTNMQFQRQDGYTDNSDLHHKLILRNNLTFGEPGQSHLTLSLGAFDLDTQLPDGLSREQWEAGMDEHAFNHTDGKKRSQYDASLTHNWVLNANNELINLLWLRTSDTQRWEDCGNIWGTGAPDQGFIGTKRNDMGFRSKYRYQGDIGGHYTSFTVGFDYRRDDISNLTYPTTNRQRNGADTLNKDIVYTDLGVYANVEYDIIANLRAYLGLRWDRLHYDIQDNLTDVTTKWDNEIMSPKFGITYFLNDNVSFYAQYATGSMHADTNSVTDESMAKSHNYEIGSKGRLFNDRLEYLLALYYTQGENWPLYDIVNKQWVYVGNTESYGFELGLKYHITDYLGFFVNYGVNDTHWVDDARWGNYELDEMAGSDPWNFGAGFDWNLKNGFAGKIEYLVNGKSWVFYDYKYKEEYYHNVRLNMSYTFCQDAVKVFLDANNLLNQEGKVPWPYGGWYRPEPGTTVTAGVTLYF